MGKHLFYLIQCNNTLDGTFFISDNKFYKNSLALAKDNVKKKYKLTFYKKPFCNFLILKFIN